MYADDTICFAQDETAMNKLLASIENEGIRYGLKLNRGKCEYMAFGNAGQALFNDGTPVPKLTAVKYLGSILNNKGDSSKEVSRSISDSMVTLNKLHVFFYTSDNTITRKIQVFNAVIRLKLLYGLETLVMNTAVLSKIDSFQLKGLRKILQLPTTYINITYSNDYLRTKINEALKHNKQKPLLPLTEYHRQRRVKYLCQLIIRGDTEPGTCITFDPVTLVDHGKQRVGQPRSKWYKVSLADLWADTKKNIESVKYVSMLDLTSSTHVTAIKTYANQVQQKRES